MEAEVLEQQLHVKRALEDIQSLQTVEQRLLAELESARAAGPTQEDAEEMAYLSSRITELENELTAKAQEIEDADTKVSNARRKGYHLQDRKLTVTPVLSDLGLHEAEQEERGQSEEPCKQSRGAPETAPTTEPGSCCAALGRSSASPGSVQAY